MLRRAWIRLVVGCSVIIGASGAHAQDVIAKTTIDGVDVRIWIPQDVTTLRGLAVNPADVGGPGAAWTEVLRPLAFGQIGLLIQDMKRNNRPAINEKVFRAALDQWATELNHPELRTIPIVISGFSKGGGWSSDLALRLPQRTIAYANVCGWVTKVEKTTEEAAKVPGLFIIGGVPDGFKMLDAIPKEYDPGRQKGFAWMLAVQWGAAHDYNNANVLVHPFFEAIIHARLANDGSLKPLDVESGWLGDRTHWDTQPVTITPYKDYPGDKSMAVWLPNAYVAHAWRAFMSKDPPVKIVADGLPDKGKRTLVVKSGEVIRLRTNVSEGVDAKSIVFFDGDQPIDADWTPTRNGAHAVYVTYKTDAGKIGYSNPVLITISK